MPIAHGLPEGFDPNAYDAIVVGAGYAGSVIARELAERGGVRVCVLERRIVARVQPTVFLVDVFNFKYFSFNDIILLLWF